MKSSAPRIIAVLLTGLLGVVHLYYAFQAGALWRDEAQALAMANMPSLSEMWAMLEHESFPVLWLLILRAFESFGTGDQGLRFLGCLVGLGLIAALWVTARQMKYNPPLISLALLGFSPTFILWGDSLRAYGFGTVLILLTYMMIWKVVTSPSARNVVLAAVVSICSVQAYYHNAVILLSIGMAGFAVAVYNRHWLRAATVIGIGLVAAASLLPYLDAMQNREAWSIIFASSQFDLAWFWVKISKAMYAAGSGMQWLWLVLLIAAVLLAVFQLGYAKDREKTHDQNLALYCLCVLLISVPGYYVFLKIVGYQTQPWYYLNLLAIVAVAMDGILSTVDEKWPVFHGRLWVALGVLLWSQGAVFESIQTRQTNIDSIAARLEQSATPEDFVLVAPWYYGVSFDRYYKGSSPWLTLPPLSDHRIHRYDLLKTQMASSDPIQPVFDEITRTLNSGNKVYVVGELVVPPTGVAPPFLKPAPLDTYGWNEAAYSTSWQLQVGYFLQRHALNSEFHSSPAGNRVNPYENVGLLVVHGWRD